MVSYSLLIYLAVKIRKKSDTTSQISKKVTKRNSFYHFCWLNANFLSTFAFLVVPIRGTTILTFIGQHNLIGTCFIGFKMCWSEIAFLTLVLQIIYCRASFEWRVRITWSNWTATATIHAKYDTSSSAACTVITNCTPSSPEWVKIVLIYHPITTTHTAYEFAMPVANATSGLRKGSYCYKQYYQYKYRPFHNSQTRNICRVQF